jgi:DNA-binding transcriptional LysR family regulator
MNQQRVVPVCTFVAGPRDSGKTRHILECLRKIAGTSQAPVGTVAVLLAEEGRTRAESLSAAFPGLILRRLFLPCQCCPELARLPAALRAIREANPRLERVFIEAPDIAALRFLEEFDGVIGWPRTLVTCLSAAWFKARRLDMLSPFQHALIERADVLLEPEQCRTTQRVHSENMPTVAPFDMTLQ